MEAAANSFFPSDLVRMFSRSCASSVNPASPTGYVVKQTDESGRVDFRNDDEIELLEKRRVLEFRHFATSVDLDSRIQRLDSRDGCVDSLRAASCQHFVLLAKHRHETDEFPNIVLAKEEIRSEIFLLYCLIVEEGEIPDTGENNILCYFGGKTSQRHQEHGGGPHSTGGTVSEC